MEKKKGKKEREREERADNKYFDQSILLIYRSSGVKLQDKK